MFNLFGNQRLELPPLAPAPQYHHSTETRKNVDAKDYVTVEPSNGEGVSLLVKFDTKPGSTLEVESELTPLLKVKLITRFYDGQYNMNSLTLTIPLNVTVTDTTDITCEKVDSHTVRIIVPSVTH